MDYFLAAEDQRHYQSAKRPGWQLTLAFNLACCAQGFTASGRTHFKWVQLEFMYQLDREDVGRWQKKQNKERLHIGMVEETEGSLGLCVSFSLIDVGSGFAAYEVFSSLFCIAVFFSFLYSVESGSLHQSTA